MLLSDDNFCKFRLSQNLLCFYVNKKFHLPNLLNLPGTLVDHKLHPKRSFFYLLYPEKKKSNSHYCVTVLFLSCSAGIFWMSKRWMFHRVLSCHLWSRKQWSLGASGKKKRLYILQKQDGRKLNTWTNQFFSACPSNDNVQHSLKRKKLPESLLMR